MVWPQCRKNMNLIVGKLPKNVSFWPLGQIDFNAKDSLGWTPLMKACINGNKEVVKLLFSFSFPHSFVILSC